MLNSNEAKEIVALLTEDPNYPLSLIVSRTVINF